MFRCRQLREMNESRTTEYEAGIERMKKSKRLTAGIVFHSGSGQLCTEVYAEVKRRFDNRMENEEKIKAKKKKTLIELQRQVQSVKQIMKQPNFKYTDLKLPQLKAMCRWKKKANDNPLPTKKADLIDRLKKTMKNPSPHVSPCNSDVEDEDNDFDDVDSMDSDETAPDDNEMIFGEKDDDDGYDDDDDDDDEDDDDEDEIYEF